MEHDTAEYLVLVSVRRLHDTHQLDQLIRQIRQGSVQSHTVRSYKDQLRRLSFSIIEVEYSRILEEISMLKYAIEQRLDHEAYLPFEIEVQQLVSGTTLRAVFTIAWETQTYIYKLLSEAQTLISASNLMLYIVSQREAFSTLLGTYLSASFAQRAVKPQKITRKLHTS